MGSKFLSSLIFVFITNQVTAQYYDQVINLQGVGYSTLIDHKTNFVSARYLVTSPVNTILSADCSLGIVCNSQVFWISKSGDKDFNDGVSYCGFGDLPRQWSVGNEVIVAQNGTGGSFKCKVTAVALTNENCDCGWNRKSKIVGGVPTRVNEFASGAALVEASTRNLFCGAVIIQQKFAITAAHCTEFVSDVTKIALLVGDWNVKRGTDTPWAKPYLVAKYHVHERYNASLSLNDIALVETTEYIKYNYGVGPACLPYIFRDLSFAGKELTAIGWGTTSFAGPVSDTVLAVNLTVVSNGQCSSNLAAQISPKTITAENLCTTGYGKRDTCSQDSGGGIYYMAPSNIFPIAIVSYGIDCANAKFPSVNTRIDKYFGWIQDKTGGFYCRKT